MFESEHHYNPRESLRLMLTSVGVAAALTVAPVSVFADTPSVPADGNQNDASVSNSQTVVSSVDSDSAHSDAVSSADQSATDASTPGSADNLTNSDLSHGSETKDPAQPGGGAVSGDASASPDVKPSADAGSTSNSATINSADTSDLDQPKIGAPTIQDGVYVIGSGLNKGKVLDVANGSKANGANVQLYDSNMSDAQKWQVTYDKSTGYYRVGLFGTNKVLDVSRGSSSNGTNVWLYEKSDSVNDAQLWKIVKNGDGYSLVSKLRNNLVLDIFGGRTANGSNVQVYSQNGSAAQRFYFFNVNANVKPGDVLINGDGAYTVIAGSKDGKAAVAVGGNQISSGENIQLSDKANVASQRLYFKYDGHGYYTIMVGSSGKVLDSVKGGVTPGTNVRQWNSNGTDAQKWALRRSAEGYYTIINKASGLVLDVSGGSLCAGANVWSYNENGSAAQRFWLEKIANAADGIADTSIKNGDYVIVSNKNVVKALDVKSGSKANGANVQIYQSNMSAAQKWHITYRGNGYYTIGLSGTNKVLDISGGEARDRANVQIFDANGSDAQLWKFIKKNGVYTIVSKLRDDLVLDLSGGQTSNGANAQVYFANATAAQMFRLLAYNPDVKGGATVKDGSYVLVAGSKDGKVAVDINGGSRSNGANVQVYTRNNSYAQRFYLKSDGNGFYSIVSLNGGGSLDVTGSALTPSTNVQQWSSYNGDAQKWALRANSDGSYSFVNKATALVLDVAGGNFSNGANLQMYLDNGSLAQRFWLVESNALDDGQFYEINPFLNSNQALDIKNGSNSNGGVLQVYGSNGTLAQRYQVHRNSDGTYSIRTAASGGWLTSDSSGAVTQQGSSKTQASGLNSWEVVWNNFFYSLKNKATGLLLSAPNANSGTVVASSAMNGSANQYFIFTIRQLISNNLYEIHSGSKTGKNLDVAGGSTSAGGNIQVYGKNGTNSQKFYIIASGNGYVIKNVASNLVLDVESASKYDGANVRQWRANGTNAQLWRAEIADGGGVVLVNANSNKALTAENSGNVDQRELMDSISSAQRWLLEKTFVYGWLNKNGGWLFYYKDGSSKSFTDAAKRGWDRMTSQGVGSRTNYGIIIDQASHRTVVYQKAGNSWEPVFDWLCAVGSSADHTVTGKYTIMRKGFEMGTRQWGCEFYWSMFCPTGRDTGQRFHSLIYQGGYPGRGGKLIEDGRGTNCSHGCVRLLIDQAKWIYDHCPLGTLVWSYRY